MGGGYVVSGGSLTLRVSKYVVVDDTYVVSCGSFTAHVSS